MPEFETRQRPQAEKLGREASCRRLIWARVPVHCTQLPFCFNGAVVPFTLILFLVTVPYVFYRYIQH